ncbi:hypothetical protein NJ76_20915 [Rhodococcus sp. IITR03]|nr:hypothetical protein NJ76_20915 [Rhodococcus sp. IITR03]
MLAAAAERAAALTATRGPNLSGIKRGLHAPLISALEIRTDPSNFRLADRPAAKSTNRSHARSIGTR